ncbi:MAG: zinc-finger domain-containing protein [Xanthomonadales bacterium]|nr:zinc-finger domain-containing protein [Xanthomonadales bacterium]
MSLFNPAAESRIPANAQNLYRVTHADLPLSCPMPAMSLWNSHPKIYLPIEDEGGKAKCPYCGADYVLED